MREWQSKQPAVYILASKPSGVLYTGVTSDLFARVGVHKQDLIEGFTKKYGVHRLVYYEMHETMTQQSCGKLASRNGSAPRRFG